MLLTIYVAGYLYSVCVFCAFGMVKPALRHFVAAIGWPVVLPWFLYDIAG